MKEWEIWTEGYRATGEHADASFDGKFPGETFDEAVENYLKEREATNFHDIRSYYRKSEMYTGRNTDGIMELKTVHSIWACRLFDNEADARKSFG
jgi:hypothetical protein